jgi:hypothetical protein
MNLFRTRTFREIVVRQHPGQHFEKLAGRSHDADRQHDATITPKRLSERLNESGRQANSGAGLTRDHVRSISGFVVVNPNGT